MLHPVRNTIHVENADDSVIFLFSAFTVWKCKIETQILMTRNYVKIIGISATVRHFTTTCHKQDVALQPCHIEKEKQCLRIFFKNFLHPEKICKPNVQKDVVEHGSIDSLRKLDGGQNKNQTSITEAQDL